VAVNQYETVFIAEPEVSNEQVDQFLNKIKQIVTTHKGTLTAEDRWGRRRLAYPIGGHREGFYTVATFSAEPTVVSALEHLYNVTDMILRHLVVRHIVKKKVFAPRRPKPAGVEGARPSGRSGGFSRPRADVSAPASAEKTAATAPAEATTPAVTAPPPEGGSPQ
jgi:small subunit ribosomal protein S6